MRKSKVEKSILSIAIIISMLAPMLCNDIVYAIDETTQNESESSVTTEEKEEEPKDEKVDNSIDEETESKEDMPTDEQEDTLTQNTDDNTEPSTEPSEENQNTKAISQSVEQDEENQIAVASLEEASEKIVSAGTGTLQRAINDANPGDTLILAGGNYRNDGPITINKSITIKGTGNVPYIYNEIQINGTNANDNVVFESFSSGTFRVEDEYDYIDIQTPVNLSAKNLILWGVGGLEGQTGNRLPSLINIEPKANGTTVNVDNCYMVGSGDGIRIASSNTHISISNSSNIQATAAIQFANGSGNIFEIKDSKLSAFSTTSSEDEAISIVDQQGLTINIENCEISGADAGGNKKDINTKLFSIDDAGNGHSKNVKINIKGKTIITEKDHEDNNCIFNFGPNNEPTDNITAHVDAGVVFPSEKVIHKYNNTDDRNYVVVGVYDRYENDVFGNLDIKTYTRNDVVEGIKDYKPIVEKGHRFDKWMYKDSDEEIKEFESPYTATKNIDVFPQYVETVDVKIGSSSYTIDKGKSLEECLTDNIEEVKSKLEKIKNDLGDSFTKFVDTSTGEIFEDVDNVMKHKISTDTEILAVNDILLTVNGETFEIENASNKTLAELASENQDLKNALDSLKTVKGKDFSKFVDQYGNEVSDGTDGKESTKIIKDTILTPKYTVKVIIKKDGKDSGSNFTLEEGQTLNDLGQNSLGQDGQKLLEEIKGVTGKHFKEFVDKNGTAILEEDISSTPINQHTELTAKYTVLVTIENPSNLSEKKTYTLDEGQSLDNLTEEQKSEWREYVKGTDKEFKGFKEIENTSTPITNDITLTPKYTVIITINKADGTTENFEIDEKQTLADIKQEDKERYKKAIEKENRYFSEFVYTEEDVEKTFDEGTKITKNITLTPKFNVKITINKADGNTEDFYIGENLKLTDIKEEDKERYEKAIEKDSRTFSRFVYKDSQGTEHTFDVDNTQLNDNYILTPKFNVTIKIGQNDYFLEEGLSLSDLISANSEVETELESLKVSLDGKEFSRFSNEKGETITENTIFNDNTNILAVFKIKITVILPDGTTEDFELEEGKTLNDLTEEQKQRLDEIKAMHKEGEQFTGFIDTTTNEVLSEDAQINNNVTIEPKYEVVPVTPTPDPEENTNNNNNNNNAVSDSEETNSKSAQTASSNPLTSDNIINFVIIGLIGLTCIIVAIKLYKKNN